MKKTIFPLIVVLIFFACGQPTNYTINGTIQDGDDTVTVILSQQTSRTQFTPVDSVKATNGIFKFEGYQQPDKYTLTIKGVSASFEFFITGTNEVMDVVLTVDNLPHSLILGSELNDRYKSFEKETALVDEEMDILLAQYSDESNAISQNSRLKFDEKTKQLQTLEEKTETSYDSLDMQKTELIKNFINTNANNIAGQKVFLQAPYVFDEEALKSFVEKIEDKTTPAAKDILTRLTNVENIAVGKRFVEVTLNNPDEQPVQLSSVAGQGTYLLIDFWASWCGPCRRENPNVVALYKKYHDKGFDVIGISRDRAKEPWLKAIADDSLTWNHVWDKDGIATKLYAVDFIPTTFLLDKDGTIIARNLRSKSLQEKLAELLGE